jgi:hypothetical protein
MSFGLEQIAAYRCHARTGHFDHHFSAPFEKIAGLPPTVRFEKSQRTIGIIIKQDAHKLNDVCIIENKIEALFHYVPTLTRVK